MRWSKCAAWVSVSTSVLCASVCNIWLRVDELYPPGWWERWACGWSQGGSSPLGSPPHTGWSSPRAPWTSFWWPLEQREREPWFNNPALSSTIHQQGDVQGLILGYDTPIRGYINVLIWWWYCLFWGRWVWLTLPRSRGLRILRLPKPGHLRHLVFTSNTKAFLTGLSLSWGIARFRLDADSEREAGEGAEPSP